jgi:type IV secretion system protein VirB4
MKKIARREEQTSKFINIVMHYDDNTLLDKNGKLIKIIKLNGIDSTTKDNQTLNEYKNFRNNLLKNFSSEFAIYFWEIRRKTTDFPEGEFKNQYANEVNEKYYRNTKKSGMFHKELYIAIITKQPEGIINKSFSILKQFNLAIDKDAKQKYLVARNKELN